MVMVPGVEGGEGWPWTLRSVGPLGSTATLLARGTGIPFVLFHQNSDIYSEVLGQSHFQISTQSRSHRCKEVKWTCIPSYSFFTPSNSHTHLMFERIRCSPVLRAREWEWGWGSHGLSGEGMKEEVKRPKGPSTGSQGLESP